MASDSSVKDVKKQGLGKKRYSIIINTGAKKLQANHVKLLMPELKDLIPIIEKELKKNFDQVEIKEVNCPDLQQWCGLAEKGLCGSTRLADIGGVPYMLDPNYQHITYQIPDIVSTCGMEKALVIGAGAASPLVIGKNAELMANTFIPGPRHSRYAKVDSPKNDDDKSSDEDEEHIIDDPNEPLDGISINGVLSPKTPVIQEQNENENEDDDEEENENENNNNNDNDDKEKSPNNNRHKKKQSLSQHDAKKIVLQQMEHNPEKQELVHTLKKRQSLSQDQKKQQELLQKLQQTHLDEVPHVGLYPSEETGCLLNLFLSEGKSGSVMYIKVTKRIGEKNFTNTIRDALKLYPLCKNEDQIGLGGIFKLNKGKIKAHIMPDFLKKKCPENDTDSINQWLKWFEMGPNLLMLSTIISDDPTKNKSLHLRYEHTHFYSLNKNVQEGGHYHYDTTPDEVEYEGYFSLAEYIYRIEDAYYNMMNSPIPSNDQK